MNPIYLLTILTLISSMNSALATEMTVTKEVEMLIQVGEELMEPIKIGLFGLSVPKGVENFYQLCTNKDLIVNGQPASYVGSIFNRMLLQNVIQGGDYLEGTGDEKNSQSIWGVFFDDEDLEIEPTKGSLVYMGMRRGENGSLFFIPLTESVSHIKGDYQVFGRITRGIDVLNKIEALAASQLGEPKKVVKIVDCYDFKKNMPKK